MIEYKWSKRSKNIFKLTDNVVVLQKDSKTEEGIDVIRNKYDFYIDYLHLDNNGKLDSFIDHRNNMFVLNDDYDMRKAICDNLFEIYCVEDFKWKNQSITSLASSLFKIQNGYFPESSYNSRV